MFSREILLIGEENFNILKDKKVAVFGVGGVGGFCAEALCRSGIGTISVFDKDTVSVSNINRQIIATYNNVGESKVKEISKRLKAINPNVNVIENEVFYLPENADNYDLKTYDYVVDAVDTVSAKLEIIKRAKKDGVPVISCMGTGGKVDITKLRVADIKDTSVCPLARVIRRELKSRGIENLKVVYTLEDAVKRIGDKNSAQPSMMFVPAAAGLLLAKEVIFDLIGNKK